MSSHIQPSLKIDDTNVLANEFYLEYQNDPYPGGHRFDWTIPLEFVRGWILEAAKFRTVSKPSENEARSWFYWLSLVRRDWHLLNRSEDSDLAELCFVLNTIEELKIDVKQLNVFGQCSPFVHRQPVDPRKNKNAF